MLVEKTLSEALKDFNKGKKVLALTTMDDGNIGCSKLEDLFPEDTHFLVDVPAYVNPDFESALAVPTVIHSKETSNQEETESEEGDTPTPKGSAKKRGGRTVKECDVELLKKYIAEKKSNKDIAGIMGVSVSTVKKWIREQELVGKREEEEPEEKIAGHNADRHLCKDCRFRSSKGKGCDYIIIAGKQRGCAPEDCNVYEKE